ncbi:MAG: DMT family transporter [Acetobacteraceae bacterium]|nr:DMT family transporter [Acetobacteraceae bacterium]
MTALPRGGGGAPRIGLRYLLVSVTLFGGIWPITKHAIDAGASSLWFALNRAALAALVSGLLLAALGRLRLPARADRPTVVAVGLLQIGSFFALAHLALDYVPAGRTAILGNVTVFWLIPLSVLVLGERVSPRQWWAAGIGLLGVAMLMAPWSLLSGATIGMLPGYVFLLAASLAWSIAILVTRRFPPTRPVLELLPWCFALGALLILPLALWRAPEGGLPREALWHALFVGAFAAPIGTWATIEAGRRLSGVMTAVGFLLIPAMGVIVSHLWLDEALGWDIVLGGLLIGASVWLASRG